MDEDLRTRIEQAVERHALINAVKHDGAADVGAIMGPLMSDHPEFREYGDRIPGIAGPVIERINDLGAAEQRDRLADRAPDALAELEAAAEADEQTLPALPQADAYDEVRMRAAPNPNGPWHLGHARMPSVIGTYRDRYDGWFCVRFDDTDPETKRPDLDAYSAILEDIEYLGFEPDAVYRASDRLEVYYEHARELIERGGAYTCDLPGDKFSKLKNAGEPSPNRDKPPETVHEEFDKMVAGEYESGEMVLRVKTDIKHKNPALRDWVAFRMLDTPHPREEASEYRCWPMLDFQSGIDDHELGITHIIRGIDLQDSAKRQQFVYDYFGWEYPEVVHWGHVEIDGYGVALSTSSIKDLIEEGTLDGWDDPRAPTLASLRRRGIQGDAIVEAMTELGTSTSNVSLSMSAVYAANRERIDADADRYFFVHDGRQLPLTDAPAVATPPRHPEFDRGTREIPVGDAVILPAEDVPPAGDRVWLKGLGAVQHEEGGLVATGDDIDVVREDDVAVVHWVPADESVPLRLRGPEGDRTGHAEPGITDVSPDTLVQFERVGFARLDQQRTERVAYFAHR